MLNLFFFRNTTMIGGLEDWWKRAVMSDSFQVRLGWRAISSCSHKPSIAKPMPSELTAIAYQITVKISYVVVHAELLNRR